MSGSGGTVFGVFGSEGARDAAFEKLSQLYGANVLKAENAAVKGGKTKSAGKFSALFSF